MKLLKLTLILPAANLVVAAFLLFLGRLRAGGLGLYSRSLLVWLCDSINVPAAILRNLLTPILKNVFMFLCSSSNSSGCYFAIQFASTAVFLVAIGATWYKIGLELERKYHAKANPVTLKSSLRVAEDISLILVGILFALVGLAAARVALWYSPTRAALVILPYCVWAAATIIYSSRDLIGRRRPVAPAQLANGPR